MSKLQKNNNSPTKPVPLPSSRKKNRALPEVPSSEQSRSQTILWAAFDVFSEAGFSGTRMDKIAERAGVAKGLLYFYYKDKEQLFDAVLQECITLPLHDKLLEFNPADSIAKRLIMILDYLYFEIMPKRFFANLVKLFITSEQCFQHIRNYHFQQILSPLLTLLQESLEEGARRGEWKPDVILQHVQIILAPGIIYTLWNMNFDKQLYIDLEAYCREHQTFLLRSLGLDDTRINQAFSTSRPSAALAKDRRSPSPVVHKPPRVRKPIRRIKPH